jgi:hypothetical protein
MLWRLSSVCLRLQACGGPCIKVYEVTGKGKRRGAEGRVLTSLMDVPKKGINCLSFAKLGHQLVVGAADHNLRVYKC